MWSSGKEMTSLGPHILIHEGYFTLCEMNKTVNCDSQGLVILTVTALGELRYAPFRYPRLRGQGLCHDTTEQSCAQGRRVKCSEAAHRQHAGSILGLTHHTLYVLSLPEH